MDAIQCFGGSAFAGRLLLDLSSGMFLCDVSMFSIRCNGHNACSETLLQKGCPTMNGRRSTQCGLFVDCILLTSSGALGGQLTSLNCDSLPVILSNDIAVHAGLLRRLDEAMTQNPLPHATCKVSAE